MVELLEERLERSFHFRKVDQPAGLGVDLPVADQLDPEAMAVQPAALVARRGLGKPMGGLERKVAHQANSPTGGLGLLRYVGF